MKRAVFSDAVKDKAVAALETGSVTEVAAKFKVSPVTQRKWARKPKKDVTPVRDAIVFLRHARRAIAKGGARALEDPVAGYVLTALNILEVRA